MGALVAAAASVGLAWWLGGDNHGALSPGPAARPPAIRAAPRAYAPADAEAQDVHRAYDDVRRLYADGGAAALARRSQACSDALPAQPEQLDYCLAFDVYARPIVAGGDDPAATRWFADNSTRDRATAQLFLGPDQDVDQRLAQVEQLSRAAMPVVHVARVARAAHLAAAPKPKVRAVRAIRAKAVVARSSRTCRLQSTPAARAVCANPSLRQADRRLAVAYDQALAAGVSRRRLARRDADWRVAMNAASANPRRVQALYETRIRELRDAARR